MKWRAEEASQIYYSACDLVARSIRPEKPPRLRPQFVLVLGTQQDETVRDGTSAEIHLKSWNPAHFAEAVVIMAAREVVMREEIAGLARYALIAAEARVSVPELKAGH